MKLTIKQEKFSQAFFKTSNASEAYRQSYNASKMKPTSINRKAFDVLNNVNVAARVKQLRDNHAKKHEITVDKLMEELEEARLTALHADTPQANAAVSATMGKAKLAGLDKQVIDHTSSDGSMSPTAVDLTDEELSLELEKYDIQLPPCRALDREKGKGCA